MIKIIFNKKIMKVLFSALVSTYIRTKNLEELYKYLQ